MTKTRNTPLGARSILVAAAALLIVGVIPRPATASPRAWPLDLPTGERYYIFAVGGSFPDGHKLEIWKETNGLLACSIPESPPIGHATEPSGDSGLQVTPITCEGTAYAADTRVVPPPEDAQPPPSPPSPPPSPASGATPPAGGGEPAATTPGGSLALAPVVPAEPTVIDPTVITVGDRDIDPVPPVPAGAGSGIVSGMAAVALVVLGSRIERLWSRRGTGA